MNYSTISNTHSKQVTSPRRILHQLEGSTSQTTSKEWKTRNNTHQLQTSQQSSVHQQNSRESYTRPIHTALQ